MRYNICEQQTPWLFLIIIILIVDIISRSRVSYYVMETTNLKLTDRSVGVVFRCGQWSKNKTLGNNRSVGVWLTHSLWTVFVTGLLQCQN